MTQSTSIQSRKRESLMRAVEGLSAEAQLRAAEFELGRELPLDFYTQLKESGIFRVLVPQSQGGLGGSFLDWFYAIERLAMADASAGWVASHGAVTASILSSVSGPELDAEFFANTTNSASWSNLASIESVEVPGGLSLSGRWRFVTGCQFADFVGGMVKLEASDQATPSRVVSILMPRTETQIESNWDPIGLAGTGSHDVVVDQQFVPWACVVDWPRPWSATKAAELATNRDNSPYAPLAFGTWPISINCAAIQLGVARHALDEIDRQLTTKRDSFTGAKVAVKPHIMTSLEAARGKLVLCRSAFEQLLTRAWEEASASGVIGTETRSDLRLGCVSIVHECRDVVSSAFDAGGSGALSRSNPLEKLYRDASCLTSHVSVSKSSFETTSQSRGEQNNGAWL